MKKSFILISVGILLYSFSLFNGFVWDDELMNNPQLSAATAYFRPAMTVVNGTLFGVFGTQPFIFHLISVIFHIATAVLLFYLFKRFFKENNAFFLSLIFLVHPALVEAVCFASALQEILFTFTGILALYIISRTKNSTLLTVFSAIILCFISLLMKETGIVFFVVLFCYLLFFHRKDTSEIQLYSALAVIVVFTYGMARLTSGSGFIQGVGLFPIMRVPLWVRFMNIPMIITYYIGTFFFPFHLGIAQHWVIRSMDIWHFWVPFGAVFVLFALGLYLLFPRRRESSRELPFKNEINRLDPRLHGGDTGKRQNNFFFFFLWFLLGLLPHLQLIPLNMTVAERWLYFPMIGMLGMIGSMLTKFEIINLKFKIAGIIIISLLFIRSFSRTLDWRNGLALYSSSISSTSSFDLQNNMGVELFRIGKYAQAKPYFEASVRLAPYWWVNWNNLGAVYEYEKNIPKAKECYERAIQNGSYFLAYENLARILVMHGTDKKKAMEFVEKALRMFPNSETLQLLNSKR